MTLRTRKDLIRSPREPDPSASPLGDTLWRRTSMVRPRAPLAEIRGALKPHTIHAMRPDGRCVTRPYVVPRDPKTARQLRRRQTLPAAGRHWSTLPAEVREAWRLYAHTHQTPLGLTRSKPGDLPLNAFIRAQVYRHGMNLPFAQTAPALPPPAAAVSSIEELPPATPATFRFRLFHTQPGPVPAGHRVLIELTRPLPSPRRRPRRSDFLWSALPDAESFHPLAASGAVYEIAHPSVEIPPGSPYAVRARLLTEDGLPGPAATARLTRL